MKYWVKNIVAAGLAVAVVSAGLAATQPAYADAVKDRRAEMKKISKANKAIKKAAKAGDAATVGKQAMMIAAVSDKLNGLFPKGTDRGMLGKKKTRAKAAIWSDWGTFRAKNAALKSAAMKIASAAKGGDLKAAMKGVGKNCGSCHKLFRAKKAKKKKKM